jgi:hypothetical protein
MGNKVILYCQYTWPCHTSQGVAHVTHHNRARALAPQKCHILERCLRYYSNFFLSVVPSHGSQLLLGTCPRVTQALGMYSRLPAVQYIELEADLKMTKHLPILRSQHLSSLLSASDIQPSELLQEEELELRLDASLFESGVSSLKGGISNSSESPSIWMGSLLIPRSFLEDKLHRLAVR